MEPSAHQVAECPTLGLDPLAPAAGACASQIGYMPQGPALYEDLSARDNVTFFGQCPRSTRSADAGGGGAGSDRPHGRGPSDPVRQFSGGMQRRVSLACALVHQPRMLFLDEPTAAVDPALRARFWPTFRDLAAAGVTLFISTHLMDEALLCDEVAILRQGRIVARTRRGALLARGPHPPDRSKRGPGGAATIGSRPEDLAGALRRYGLAPEVSAVVVEPDTLETVVLSLVTGRKGVRQHGPYPDRGRRVAAPTAA